MSGNDWLDHGPDEWTRRYIASRPPFAAAFTAWVFWWVGRRWS